MTLTSGHWLRNPATVLLSTCLIILRLLSLVLGSTELTESRPQPEESGTCMQGWLVSSSEFITWPEVMTLLDDRACPVCATFLLLRRAIPDWESLGVWALSIFPAPYKELLKVYMSLSTLSYKVLICPQKQALLGKGDFQKFLDVSWSYPSLHPTLCF